MTQGGFRPKNRADLLASVLGLQSLFYRDYSPEIKAPENRVVSPCRSQVAQMASIGQDGRVPEKKFLGRRRYFSLSELVNRAGHEAAETVRRFHGGQYLNLYLSPWDYHFLIFPTDSRVIAAFEQDGFNLPVVAWEGAVFRNSKLITILNTGLGFQIGLVMVASWMVGGMDPLFEMHQNCHRGDLFARFRIGSTVILLFPPDKVEMTCRPGQKLELGDEVAKAL
jgi:phosphatidylserine decarboxylase